MASVFMLQLGCPKNQTDGERMLYKLKESGFEIRNVLYEGEEAEENAAEHVAEKSAEAKAAENVDEAEAAENVDEAKAAENVDEAEAAENAAGNADENSAYLCDLMIINTCAFIEDAKRESIEAIIEAGKLKEQGLVGKFIVTGCLAERYLDELESELPEVDSAVGLGCNGEIAVVAKRTLCGERIFKKGNKLDLPSSGGRLLCGSETYAYLKIAEGCSNNCSFCAIPKIRGRFRSLEPELVEAEARSLVNEGISEIILVAQDTSAYGIDLYGSSRLPELISRLCAIEGLRRLRLLYCYPEGIDERLIECFEREPKLCRYLDIPIQHINDRLLKAMNRHCDSRRLKSLLHLLRERLPDLTLRTTLITGFPGETDEDFEELALFVKEERFDRLGCFAYSPEEGTRAERMKDRPEPEIARHRAELIRSLQYGIMSEINASLKGRIFEVSVSGFDSEGGLYFGRSYREAPEIDDEIYFRSDSRLSPGDFVNIRICGAEGCSLIGEYKQGV